MNEGVRKYMCGNVQWYRDVQNEYVRKYEFVRKSFRDVRVCKEIMGL